MTAAQKRKYLYSIVLEQLQPYGYFEWKGAVWKYVKDGYVIKLYCDITRGGELNDIFVYMCSAYEPIRKAESLQDISYSTGLYFSMYTRAKGYGIPWLYASSFEEGVKKAEPYLKTLLLPVLSIGDGLDEYMQAARTIEKMEQDVFEICPFAAIEPTELAYLSLACGKPQQAQQYVSEYIEYYQKAIERVQADREKFWYMTDERLAHMAKNRQDGEQMLQELRSGSPDKIAADMEAALQTSRQTCEGFFGRRRGR